MTASTPPLVDVIAGALESHLGMERETWNIDPEYFRGQARAVLAAISEAGTVEWGSKHVIEGKRAIEFHTWPDQNVALEKVDQYGGRVVSRITLPWERAE